MSKPIKYNTKDLKNIIHKFYLDKNYIGSKLTFSQLARYASEILGYNDIKYYTFARNKEINELVNKYNYELEKTHVQYSDEDSEFIRLNVKEFVKINLGNKQQLTLALMQLQDSLKNIYDSKVEIELRNKKLNEDIQKSKDTINKYKEKNCILKKELEKAKEDIKKLKDALEIQDEKQLITALNSTGVKYVEFEGEAKVKEDISELTEENGKDLKKLMSRFKNLSMD